MTPICIGSPSPLDIAPSFSLIVTPAGRAGRMLPHAPAYWSRRIRMAFTQSASIEVKRIKGKGRGVFARRLIPKGELIEKVPMLVLPVEEYHDGLGGTSLAN